MSSMSLRLARLFLLLVVASLAGRSAQAGIAKLRRPVAAPANSFFNGPTANGQVVDGQFGPEVVGTFASGGVQFLNRYDPTFGSWSGFAYSNTTDTTTPGFTNQYSAYAGAGHGPGGGNYGVASGFDDLTANSIDPNPFDPTSKADLMQLPHFTLPSGSSIQGMYVTNTTYAALSMLMGDSFAKKFGGATGNDPDYFKLSAYGTDAAGNVLSQSVDFYLADYRFADNSLDYIVKDWTFMDLSALSGASTLYFNLSSSDVGPFGMNTPGNFAVDDIMFTSAVVPEPSSWLLCLIGAGASSLPFRRRRSQR